MAQRTSSRLANERSGDDASALSGQTPPKKKAKKDQRSKQSDFLPSERPLATSSTTLKGAAKQKVPNKKLTFLDEIPGELRNEIYLLVARSSFSGENVNWLFNLLHSDPQIRREVLSMMKPEETEETDKTKGMGTKAVRPLKLGYNFSIKVSLNMPNKAFARKLERRLSVVPNRMQEAHEAQIVYMFNSFSA
ncbi:hypothetical protein CKM354_000536000 [Cercospora kikuchii]|uniref:Uncharacterized protein n=1 Tax=Cercospora kikuchii TaxID=84275 RepID=A0A9P3CKF3_9PEZI|nr:uncharacterized protein CKM354_000536000 [Cercospora kikuchii]GIZ42080.1 hypothetical protein CKM354_000536000 [Cercospora kikuchii]